MDASKDKHKPLSIIAHVDMDCFYCAVERGLDPTLNGIPMAGEILNWINKWIGANEDGMSGCAHGVGGWMDHLRPGVL